MHPNDPSDEDDEVKEEEEEEEEEAHLSGMLVVFTQVTKAYGRLRTM